MNVTEIAIGAIVEAGWNPNRMDGAMLARLQRSMETFGAVVPLVVRPVGDGRYETVGGAHRLHALRRLGRGTAPCVVVEADDAQARLLSQALNRVHGEDDPGLQAELLRAVLERVPREEVLSLLPDTGPALESLAAMGSQDMAEHLRAWQRAREARLRHFQAQLTEHQLEVVEEALARFMPHAGSDDGNPNRRGVALYRLCCLVLEKEGWAP